MSILTLLLILKIILVLVAAGSIVFFFFAVYSIYIISITGVPWAKTPRENIDKIFKEINLPKNSLFYDLGCGDGRILFMAENQGYRAKGFELSLYPYLKAVFNKYLTGSKVEIKRQDFYKIDLSQADAVFIFLNAQALVKLSQKLKQKLRPGVAVISYGFAIPGWQINRIIATKPRPTYVYKVCLLYDSCGSAANSEFATAELAPSTRDSNSPRTQIRHYPWSHLIK